jgi:hypothetical protein
MCRVTRVELAVSCVISKDKARTTYSLFIKGVLLRLALLQQEPSEQTNQGSKTEDTSNDTPSDSAGICLSARIPEV